MQDRAMPQPDKQLSEPLASPPRVKAAVGEQPASVSWEVVGCSKEGTESMAALCHSKAPSGQAGLPRNSHHSSVGAEQNGRVCVLLCSPKGEEYRKRCCEQRGSSSMFGSVGGGDGGVELCLRTDHRNLQLLA